MSATIIELHPKPPSADYSDGLTFLACKSCRNKTYVLMYDASSAFPLMKCAACGQAMGRMGWYHDDEPETEVPA
jgi:hypothetical protein